MASPSIDNNNNTNVDVCESQNGDRKENELDHVDIGLGYVSVKIGLINWRLLPMEWLPTQSEPPFILFTNWHAARVVEPRHPSEPNHISREFVFVLNPKSRLREDS